MKITPSEMLIDLDNKPIKLSDRDLTLGRAIALILITGTDSPDPLRSYTLARKLTDSENITDGSAQTLELDAADTDFIRTALKSTKNFSTIVTGQIFAKL